MNETSEQRIERVARAMFESMNKIMHVKTEWDTRIAETQENYRRMARAADAISFLAGWDAAAELLRVALRGGDQRVQYALERLDANRPGEAP